jgi:dihydropyrimidinase/dihydroorotase
VIVETVIRNGLVVTPAGTLPGGIAIDDGKIAAVTTDQALPQAREVIDAKGCYITPGFIDAHTHQGVLYEYGLDVRGRGILAAQGGVTTHIGIERSTRIGDGPLRPAVVRGPSDVTPYAAVHDIAREKIDANAYVDMAITFLVLSEGHVDEIPTAVRDYGVTSFKYWTWALGKADLWGARRGTPMSGFDQGTLYRGFEAIGKIGRPAMALIHAENRFIERVFRDRVMARGGKDLRAVAEVCPPICEIADIRFCALIARYTKCPLYVVHLSTADALPEIERAREEGTDFTVEVNVPWLSCTVDDDPPGVYGKFLPPLRDRDNLERLWEGLRNKTVQCLGTDDATVTWEWKENSVREVAAEDKKEGMVSPYASVVQQPGEPHNVWTLGPASSGVETYVPALMTYGVLAGRISVERLVEVACENNAKAFALYPKKGALLVGSDADVNIIDPKLKRKVVGQRLPQDPRERVFNFLEGRELAGWPTMTMVRGKVVCRDGNVVGEPGWGRYLERKGYPQPYPWWPR